MCWVAIDRALRLADKRSFPADRDRWTQGARRDLRRDPGERLEHRSQRVRAVLRVGLARCIAADDAARVLHVGRPIREWSRLSMRSCSPPAERGLVSDGLVYRYNAEETPDGLQGREGTFNICTFWLVEALTRMGRRDRRRLEDARLMFERMLGYANHLGLYAEQTGPRGEALGNFPQAFTHLALISAAYNLDRSLGGESLEAHDF